mmetsp:Transcript_36082/g.115499  ORF Transcript_36082/g.115499 Transcript_36082/m.115499 type:complete len:303 (-) Transcript_36082:181-1089(-)
MKPTHLYLSLATLLGGACGFAHPGAARVRLGGGHAGARANRLARPQAAAAPADNGVDVMQAAKYPVATACQFGLIAALFRAIDAVGTTPAPLVPPLFALLSLRSRIFSLLPANRPPRGGFDVEGKRTATPAETIRPSWTPPGIAFPFIWLTITALRAASSLVVFKATGRVLCSPALLVLALHLCVGDTWNCVTNVEQRKGVSAVGVLAVWTSVVAAVKAFYDVAPAAGLILAPSAVWISIASVLTWTIWRINPPLQPLYPRRSDASDAKAALVLPLVFRPRQLAKVLTTPPVGPPQKKEEAV